MPAKRLFPFGLCVFISIWLHASWLAAVDWPQLKFTEVANGLVFPTHVASVDDGSGRLFVTEQQGRVMLVQSNGVVPFLDVRDQVLFFFGGEDGLLSIAFPPGFAAKLYFYVYYSRATDGASVISRFYISTDGNSAERATEQPVLVVEKPNGIVLRGGLLLFGPDEYLYAGIGDSGFLEPDANTAQDTRSFWGKILRIDVETSTNGYLIPPNNPFVGNPAYLPEIWALGLRNPWRFSFDRTTADFYVGDVGQREFEEVNFVPAGMGAGRNYGWPLREGKHKYALNNGTILGPLTEPVTEFRHIDSPASVTGGFVYRGPQQSRMSGIYFYADFYSGRIWGMARDGTNWMTQELASTPYFISTFGEDQAGNLYLADYVGGTIYRIEDSGQAAAPTFSPAGIKSHTEHITLSCISPGATIHYTTDGRNPGSSDAAVTSGGMVTVASGATLKARAFRADLKPSAITVAAYDLKVARPVFNPAQGPITNGEIITISSITPAATIRYSLDGSDPTASSPIYSSPIPYEAGVRLKARAFRPNFDDSTVAEFSPSILTLEELRFDYFTFRSVFGWHSLSDWTYQVQVADDPTDWRDLGGVQFGTGSFIRVTNGVVSPVPAQRLYRVKAAERLGF